MDEKLLPSMCTLEVKIYEKYILSLNQISWEMIDRCCIQEFQNGMTNFSEMNF